MKKNLLKWPAEYGILHWVLIMIGPQTAHQFDCCAPSKVVEKITRRRTSNNTDDYN